ncbi:MAG: hypothetical protein GF400_02090 [Candidatus Eisenbacteria bacterium]|nr:hypothetical protein [Candidatus Eisenbacteria bacterium]
MKRVLILSLCLLFVAGAAFASQKHSGERTASEIMFPIEYYQGQHRTMFEGFESGVPPTGWTLFQTNTVETWGVDTYNPYEGLQYASCQYDATYSGPQDEWLYTDYTIEAGDECLSFYAFASTYWAVDPYQNYNILVTINDQIVWDYLNDNNGAVTWQWQQYSVDLTGYDVGETITIGLGYQGYDGAQGAFDAVEIGECPPPPPEPCCPSENVCYVMDFNDNPCSATPEPCGIGPVPWEWGAPVGIPTVACDDVPVTNVWGTVLAADYPVSVGEALVMGPCPISADCYCMELCHYYDTEFGYDGGNVKVSTDGGATWTLVQPFGGYDDVLDSTSYVAECVAMEEVFCGDSISFVRDCFDLTEFVGQEIMIGFFFGSESWDTTDLGWYLKWVKIGGDEYSPVQNSTWGAIKGMYR